MNDDVKKLGEPLTMEQLRGMDGEPVLLVFDFELEPMISLIEYVQDADCIILTNNLGGRSEFYSDEELREYGIKAYAYPPIVADTNVGSKLKEWEPCEYCNGRRMPYQHTRSTKLFLDTFGSARTLVTECNACPPYADCCMKDISVNSAFPINFCPNCGKPLTEEARAMLEKRLGGVWVETERLHKGRAAVGD